MIMKASHLLGRRGACLLLAGFIWLLVAWAVSKTPLPPGRPPAPHELLPLSVRVFGWAATGVAGIVAAWWPPGRDDYGFFAMMFMPAERVMSWTIVLGIHLYNFAPWLVYAANPMVGVGLAYMHGKIFLQIPTTGIALGGFGAWAATCAFMFVISGWPEPVKAMTTSGER